MPPAAISPKGRFNQGGARSSGAHLNHLSSGPLRKRCRVEKTKVSEKDAGYHAAELSLGELRLAGAPVREKEGARAFARCHTIRCRLDRVKELTRLDMEKGEDRERRTWESKICNSSGPYRRNLLASPIAMAAKTQTPKGSQTPQPPRRSCRKYKPAAFIEAYSYTSGQRIHCTRGRRFYGRLHALPLK